MKEFEGRVAVITGASSSHGIGAASALELSRQGARGLVLNSRRSGQESLLNQLEQQGTPTVWVSGDVSEEETAKKIFKAAKEKFGTIDALIQSAGVTRDKPINGMSKDDWDQVVNTSLKASFLLARESIGVFPRREGGSMVFIGSVVGEYGNSGQANYAAAKAGLSGLTRSLAIDLGRRNIRVNTVAPGFIATEMTAGIDEEIKEMIKDATPLRRLGTAEDVASLVGFLAGERSKFITGQTYIIDGGLDGGMNAVGYMVRSGYKKGSK